MTITGERFTCWRKENAPKLTPLHYMYSKPGPKGTWPLYNALLVGLRENMMKRLTNRDYRMNIGNAVSSLSLWRNRVR